MICTFNNFIREQHLIEISIKGRNFTWSNMQDNPLLEQLDWFFSSLHWTTYFPSTIVNPQGKPTSDPIPLVVSTQTSIPACKIFRFENFLIAHQGFQEVVDNSWNRPTFKENSAANLNAKFKRFRYDLKKWSKSISRLAICIENSNKAILDLINWRM